MHPKINESVFADWMEGRYGMVRIYYGAPVMLTYMYPHRYKRREIIAWIITKIRWEAMVW